MTRALVLLPVLAAALPADTAVQTDWSGGPGVPGPVTSWGSEFSTQTQVDWESLPGSICISFGAITHDVQQSSAIYTLTSCDMDFDGDSDLVGSSRSLELVAWWENTDGSGEIWTRHVIEIGPSGAYAAEVSDIDGDGDPDVVSSWFWEDELVWYENDGTGSEWYRHLVTDSLNGAKYVSVADLDGDSDYDIAATGFSSPDQVSWWENLNGYGLSWERHVVVQGGSTLNPYCVVPCDIDLDGDSDLVGCLASWEIVWWENDGSGGGWEEHLVYDHETNTLHADCADIDGDGDIDVLGAISHPNTPPPHFGEVVWCENLDSIGTQWQRHVIRADLVGASCVHCADMDLDGDIDVLGTAGTSWGGEEVIYWENADGAGLSWTEHLLSDWGYYARDIEDADFDLDGRPDAVVADEAIHGIWYDLTGYSPAGSLESSILDTQTWPDWGTIDWVSDEPSGTSLTFQVRTGDSPGSLGEWSGEITSPGSLDPYVTGNHRYLQYRVNLYTLSGYLTPQLDHVSFSYDPQGVAEPEPEAPVLLGPVSNPSGGGVVIRFGIPEASLVSLSVFDIAGRLVGRVSSTYSGGTQAVGIGELQPGVYMVRMESGDFTAAGRFVVIE
ncbi:T9SS type A sorting domain-containing protein [Candidatus Fermentibacterales bacterium]|nr:T9SS type A sorting domain-containing protein [Candidatus Fermentibacterales bacterium]